MNTAAPADQSPIGIPTKLSYGTGALAAGVAYYALTGTVLQYEAGGLLEFSWSWDNLPPDSTVLASAEPGPAAGSALLTIRHGPHAADDAGRTAHQEHWDGWHYFLPRLTTALS